MKLTVSTYCVVTVIIIKTFSSEVEIPMTRYFPNKSFWEADFLYTLKLSKKQSFTQSDTQHHAKEEHEATQE